MTLDIEEPSDETSTQVDLTFSEHSFGSKSLELVVVFTTTRGSDLQPDALDQLERTMREDSIANQVKGGKWNAERKAVAQSHLEAVTWFNEVWPENRVALAKAGWEPGNLSKARLIDIMHRYSINAKGDWNPDHRALAYIFDKAEKHRENVADIRPFRLNQWVHRYQDEQSAEQRTAASSSDAG